MLGVQVYEGLFLAIPILQEKKSGKRKSTAAVEIGNLDEPAALRLKELPVVDIAFLHGTDLPVLAVLHRDGKPEAAQLSTYSIQRSGGTYELTDWEIKHNNLEAEAKILIPLPEPIGGVLVVGEQVVVYLPPPGEQGIKRPLYESTIFQAWTMIDRQRYLLSDDAGKLKMLFLELDKDKKIVDIKVETIGEVSKSLIMSACSALTRQTSIATKLQYLGNGQVYVGSFSGDSQLVKLSSEYPKCRVLQNFVNLAPILDFQVVGESHSSTEGQQSQYTSGQMRIVLGSGGFQAGTLRSLRSGVGLRDSAILGDMEGVRALRALKCNPDSKFDDALVVSFINETRVFSFDAEGEVEELEEFKGFSLDEETLLAKVVLGAKLLQVTPSMIKVMDAESGTVLSEILSLTKIIAATANNDVLTCDVGNKALVVYDLKGELAEVNRRSFEHEIACLYAPPEFPDVLAVCFWTAATVALLSLPGLETLSKDSLGGGTNGVAIPRSVILAKVLENQPPSLLVAMGDGTLYTFSVNNYQKYLLSQKKAVALETQEFCFEPIPRKDDIVSIFAACDHPSLIYSDDGRIMYSAVTAEKVTHLCTFNAAAFPSSVVILSDGELKISIVDTAQNIHVKTLKVGDIVRRVSYSHARRIYGIVTIQLSLHPETSEEQHTSYVRVVDDTEFAVVDSYRLLERELVESILCARLDNGDGTKSEKFLVGTGFQPDPDTNHENECKEGRILIFEFSEDRKLKLAAELVVRGAVKSLDMVGDMIVAALDKTVYCPNSSLLYHTD
jgi:DNA damage-binding protein 1